MAHTNRDTFSFGFSVAAILACANAEKWFAHCPVLIRSFWKRYAEVGDELLLPPLKLALRRQPQIPQCRNVMFERIVYKLAIAYARLGCINYVAILLAARLYHVLVLKLIERRPSLDEVGVAGEGYHDRWAWCRM
ncbi:hypothetical protein CFE70_002819 [Pyrenophora teres f. teres 0-1]